MQAKCLHSVLLKEKNEMGVLSGLEPKSVFEFFEELCAIPHGSHNTKAISDYLVSFAEKRGLKYRQDEFNNVIIWKDAVKGYEDVPVVMLQGHMDMVCEKEKDCGKNMETEGLDIFVDGDLVGAHGTTLGGDDCIAVAMAMAILDSDDIEHGPLECVFTVDEEVGMTGAMALDTSDLHAKYLLNLDSEEEKVFTVSCAGSSRVICSFNTERKSFEGDAYALKVSGLAGGHSGEEINKGRANSNIVMGRALFELSKSCDMRLVKVSGGAKENAIPRESEAVIVLNDEAAAKKTVEELDTVLKNEYRATDSTIEVSLTKTQNDAEPMTKESTQKIICFLFSVPNGVQNMSAEVPGLVQTSTNLGVLSSEENSVKATFMVRSSVNSQRDEVNEKISALAEVLGGAVEIPVSSSAWEYMENSKLREYMIECFRNMYGEEPVVAALHAGLECGVFSGKILGLDCISFGPDLTDIHTPRERLHIASLQRVWQLTLDVLKTIR